MSIRKLIDRHKISFMDSWTKHKRTLKSRIKRMWGNDIYDMCEVYASDTNGGGFVVIWDSTTLRVTNKLCGDRWILIEGCIINALFECTIGVIYGPNDRA